MESPWAALFSSGDNSAAHAPIASGPNEPGGCHSAKPATTSADARNDGRVVDIRRFAPEHLSGILMLCELEGWPSFPEDPERAGRVLTAPGVTTVVAIENAMVVGFAQMFSDGEIQAFLANIVVAEESRHNGIGRALVNEALRMAGGERVGLLSEEDAAAFYSSFPHVVKPGYRLYPFHEDVAE